MRKYMHTYVKTKSNQRSLLCTNIYASTCYKVFVRLIALSLYNKVAFGKFHKRHRMLGDISQCMGRTKSASPMKLSNLASLGPVLLRTGQKGLSGANALDRAVWDEFHGRQDELIPESEGLLSLLLTGQTDAPVEVQPEVIKVLRAPQGPTESTASVKVRRG
jgi:hypothetical protein